VKEGTFRRGAPCGNPSVRTQLFAADRRTSHGSKKEETLRRPKEAPKETRQSECCTIGRRRTGSLRRSQWRIVHWTDVDTEGSSRAERPLSPGGTPQDAQSQVKRTKHKQTEVPYNS